MKLLICGCRDLDKKTSEAAIRSFDMSRATEIVHGGARGVDAAAHDLFDGVLPVRVFPPDWKAFGKAAGPIRNREMAAYADVMLAVWDGKSRGTKNMIETFAGTNKPWAIAWVRGGDHEEHYDSLNVPIRLSEVAVVPLACK